MKREKQTSVPIEEFEREPVPENRLKPFYNFVGMFAGEHVAGTELLIGPLFVVHGVGAFDLLVGLLVGNLLAVLSWTFITAPIAIRHRLTLYFHLEKIGGKRIVDIYNVANGFLWCFIAAAMISVSSTAVGVPLHVKMPQLNDFWPNTSMIIISLAVGMVTAIIAANGFSMLARFSGIAAPWMAIMFACMGLAAIIKLGIGSWPELCEKATTLIWKGGSPLPGYAKFTFWHVMCFSWFGNIAWHIGMGDLSLFRYAKKARYGLASITGMLIGHYMAWIAASLLYVLQIHRDPTNTTVAPGPMADGIAGTAGILLVLVAGWSTASSILYRAGLAFQAIKPKWSLVKVTLISGLIASSISIFPRLSMHFLDFAALYGVILMPMGAVIFADHYFMKRFSMQPFYADRAGLSFYFPPAVAWVMTLLFCIALNKFLHIEVFFLSLPGWFMATLLYIVFSKFKQQSLNQKGALR